MKTIKEVKAALEVQGLTLTQCKPNNNLSRQRYYVSEGYNTLAGFDTLKEVAEFCKTMNKKTEAKAHLEYCSSLRKELKEVVYVTDLGNVYASRDRKALIAVLKKVKAIAPELEIDLRSSNKYLLKYAAKFLGVKAI